MVAHETPYLAALGQIDENDKVWFRIHTGRAEISAEPHSWPIKVVAHASRPISTCRPFTSPSSWRSRTMPAEPTTGIVMDKPGIGIVFLVPVSSAAIW
jgi:hypothetical protein